MRNHAPRTGKDTHSTDDIPHREEEMTAEKKWSITEIAAAIGISVPAAIRRREKRGISPKADGYTWDDVVRISQKIQPYKRTSQRKVDDLRAMLKNAGFPYRKG